MAGSFFILGSLGFLSGLSSAYLGVGGSLLIVPLLPLLVGLSPTETLQISLLLIFVMSIVNTLAFIYQKLVLWSWVYVIAMMSLSFSFISSLLVSFVSDFWIRFFLWAFLFLMLLLPWLLKQITFLTSQKGVWIFSSLMGLCVGMTGLGGGFIISPYLHESHHIPQKNISAVVCVSMFFTCTLALLGQLHHLPSFFQGGEFWWFCYLLLLIPSIIGLFVGYFLNQKEQSSLRRKLLLRSIIAIMFVSVSAEMLWKLAQG